jgi:hypothetical protein
VGIVEVGGVTKEGTEHYDIGDGVILGHVMKEGLGSMEVEGGE